MAFGPADLPGSLSDMCRTVQCMIRRLYNCTSSKRDWQNVNREQRTSENPCTSSLDPQTTDHAAIAQSVERFACLLHSLLLLLLLPAGHSSSSSPAANRPQPAHLNQPHHTTLPFK
jgi:hypothetical protein